MPLFRMFTCPNSPVISQVSEQRNKSIVYTAALFQDGLIPHRFRSTKRAKVGKYPSYKHHYAPINSSNPLFNTIKYTLIQPTLTPQT